MRCRMYVGTTTPHRHPPQRLKPSHTIYPPLASQVPETVRQGNAAKAEQLNTERDNVLKAIESFKALLIS